MTGRTLGRALAGFCLGALVWSCSRAAPVDSGSLRLPPGFHIEVYADVPGARSLEVDEQGTVYVGSRNVGKVYAVPDADHDGRADRVVVLASGLHRPNGVALRGRDLYVGLIDRILKFPGVTQRLDRPPAPQVVVSGLPKDEWHGYKYLRFGPDGYLYFPIGAPCNVCDCPAPYASLLRVRPDGSGQETFARGIRNTVGFDFHPRTQELWFTDNGRDNLGDNLPPDEVNCAPKPGLHFGFPYRYGNNQKDPEFGAKLPSGLSTVAPRVELPAHVAALGARFYTGKQFPAEYRGKLFIANHGSWNRSRPIGYRVVYIDPETLSQTTFLDGFLSSGGKISGRPVDIALLPDGSMVISDDHAGKLYRVRYSR